MCGRFTNSASVDYLVSEFDIVTVHYDFTPSYNVAPMQNVAVIIETDERQLVPMRWGLVPSWAKDAAMGNKMINARAETLPEKPSFRTLIKRHRCAIVADGFYEWYRAGNEKMPYYFRLKSHSPFTFAGLYEHWESPELDAPLTTCTIITTQANELVERVHERMPVMLSKKALALWLKADGKDAALDLLKPYPSEEMEAIRVSKRVNSPTYNSPDLIQAAG